MNEKDYKLAPKYMVPRPDTEEYAKEYWRKADALFYRTVGYAEDAFRTNKVINLLVVAVGIAFSIYAIAYSAFKGLDLFTTAFGTLGVATFVATLYFTPQKKIQKLVGDLTQIQMVYKTYWSQTETILDWVRDNRNKISIDDLQKITTQLDAISKRAVELVESYIGKA